MDGERFAGLWAGCDLGNTNEAEALGKFKLIRRMAAAENLRIIDVLELPEVVKAIDDQLQPLRRGQAGNEQQLREEITQLETALAERERQTAELIDHYEAKLAQAINMTRKARQYHRGVGEFLSFTWGFAQWRMVALAVVMATWVCRPDGLAMWKLVPFVVFAAWLLLLWCSAEIDETGWGLLLIKLAILVGGYKVMLDLPDFVIPVMCGLVALTATKLMDNVCEWLMDVPVIGAVIEWFV